MVDNKRLIESFSTAQEANECDDFKSAAGKIFSACKQIMGVDSGYIALFRENRTVTEVIFQDGGSRSHRFDLDQIFPDENSEAENNKPGKPVYYNDYKNGNRKTPQVDDDAKPDNVLFAPIEHKSELIGLLGLVDKPGGFNDEDTELAAVFAKNAALTFCNMRDRESRLESDIKYRNLFNNLPVGIYVTDSMDRIVEMNKKMFELLDIEKLEDFSGEDLLKHYVSSRHRIEWQEQLEKTGSVQYLETQFRGKNGEVLWISENANLLEGVDGQQYCEVSIEDITTRKNSEEAFLKTYLQLDTAHKELNRKAEWMERLNNFLIEVVGISEEEELHYFILDKLADYFKTGYLGIGEIDPDGELFVIREFRDDQNYTNKIKLEKTDLSLLNSNSHNILVVNRDDSRFSKDRSALKDYLGRIMGKDGDALVLVPINYENSVFGNIIIEFPEDDFSDNHKYFLESIAEYISVLKANIRLYNKVQDSYQQLKKAQDVIKKQERIKAMGQIASGITHDINNTLAPITLYTEALVETESGLSERALRYISTIQNAVSDIENVTQRLRTFYKQNEVNNFEVIKVEELFNEVIELTRPKWKNIPNMKGLSIGISKNIEDENISIQGVRSDIREALVNCVFNSVDAMPEGGVISLSARTDGNKILIIVDDDGLGMDDEQLNHCMEPFYTTKGASGTGLGLAEVYGMIQRHGGDVKIQSSRGAGTSIELHFKTAGEKTGEQNEDPANSLPSSSVGGMKILCVDDDYRILEGLREMFLIDGHEVSSAGSGAEALTFLKSVSKDDGFPDLVITDLGMPGMDGYELAHRIKQDYPAVPVVMLSGWGNQIKDTDYRTDEIYCILSKPPRIKVLREVLGRISSGGV